jgi:hypothetical protein
MDYTVLGEQQRAEILQSRLVNHEAQHFQAALDLEATEANAELPGQTEQVAALKARIADIERVIKSESQKLKALQKQT